MAAAGVAAAIAETETSLVKHYATKYLSTDSMLYLFCQYYCSHVGNATNTVSSGNDSESGCHRTQSRGIDNSATVILWSATATVELLLVC